MAFSGINYLAVVVCGVISPLVGTIWYSPPLFQVPWLRGLGKTPETQGRPSPVNFLIAFVAAAIEAFFLAFLMKAMGATTVSGGLLAGLIVWLGFVATTSLAIGTFEGKPYLVWVIENGAHLVTLLLIGVVLAIWR